MNEFKQDTTEDVVREGNEMLKALIAKVVDMGTELRGTGELIRQLPDQKDSFDRWNKQLDKLDEGIDMLNGCVKEMAKSFDQQVSGMDMRLVEVGSLRLELARHAQLFEKPLEKTVHYRHFIGKPLLALGGMFMALVVVVFFWIKAGWRADQYRGNDSKWRHLKLTHDSMVLNRAERIERDWLADPAGFEKLVDEEEERRNEEVEKWAEEQARHQEVDELHKGEKIK
jgi:hypothetical protein